MKKRKICLCLLLSVCLLTGCRQQSAPGPYMDALPTTTPTTTGIPVATRPVMDFTEPAEPEEPPVSLAPVTKLSAAKWNVLPQFISLGEGLVLACRNDYDENRGIVNHLQVLDVYNDTVVTQAQSDFPLELVEQSFLDGHFVLKDARSNTLTVYNQSLQAVQQFSPPNVEGYFSPDRTNYYFVENDVLYRMDVASGNYGRMTLEYDMRLESLTGVHPYWNIVVARYYRSFYDDSYGICAINCENGRFLILNEDAFHLWFDGEDFYAAVTNEQVSGVDICYGTISDGMAQKVVASDLGNDTVSYSMLSGSGIMMFRTTDDDNLSTTVYDFSNYGISCKLSRYDYNTATLGSVYLRQEQLIFGVYSENDEFYPVVIDPKVLSYEKSLSTRKEIWPALVDRTAILQYQQEVQGPELPEGLSTLRQQADTLEEKYGVKILMENQTLALCVNHAAVQGDAAMISQALNTLDQALALYPEGFLGQFQNGIGEGGLYFCLTGKIQGSLDPVGKTVKTRNRYELLLDISAQDLDKTIHHELWHAIEMELSTDSFENPQWHSLNPKDAAYYGSYDSGYEALTQWTYAQSGSKCCYVDAYSRINGREDRARIMEYAMVTDATELFQSSALKQKLEIMSNAIREHFDTTGWQIPHWEQYL